MVIIPSCKDTENLEDSHDIPRKSVIFATRNYKTTKEEALYSVEHHWSMLYIGVKTPEEKQQIADELARKCMF